MNQEHPLFSSQMKQVFNSIDPHLTEKQFLVHASRKLLEDPLMQPFFRNMIQKELQLQRMRNKGNSNPVRNVRHQIKKVLVRSIRKQYHKLHPNSNFCPENNNISEKTNVIDLDGDSPPFQPMTTQGKRDFKRSQQQKKPTSETSEEIINKIQKPKISWNVPRVFTTTVESPESQSNQQGHFLFGDQIKLILDSYLVPSDKEDKTVLIQWKTRKDGKRPRPSLLPLSDLAYHRPFEAKLYLSSLNQQ